MILIAYMPDPMLNFSIFYLFNPHTPQKKKKVEKEEPNLREVQHLYTHRDSEL